MGQVYGYTEDMIKGVISVWGPKHERFIPFAYVLFTSGSPIIIAQLNNPSQIFELSSELIGESADAVATSLNDYLEEETFTSSRQLKDLISQFCMPQATSFALNYFLCDSSFSSDENSAQAKEDILSGLDDDTRSKCSWTVFVGKVWEWVKDDN